MRARPARTRGTRMGFILALGLMAAALHVAQAEEEGAHPLVGTAWRATAIGDTETRGHEASTLAFSASQRVTGGAACNRFAAPVSLAGEKIAIGPLAVTRKACPPAVMDQERRYLTALAAAARVVQEGERLRLLDADGRVLVRLRRIGVASEPLAVGEGAGAEGSPGDAPEDGGGP